MTPKELELTQKLSGLLAGLGVLEEYIDSAIESFDPSIFQELGETLTSASGVKAELDEDGVLLMSWDSYNESYNIPDGLVKYDDSTISPTNPFVEITEIIVPTIYDKDQLIKSFQYIHNLRSINSDYIGVNTIMHMYTVPERIVVNPFKVSKT